MGFGRENDGRWWSFRVSSRVGKVGGRDVFLENNRGSRVYRSKKLF